MIPKFQFGSRSVARLNLCHRDLQMLAEAVIEVSPEDITVVTGSRGEEAQDKAYNEGHSKVKYPHSMHNIQPSMAMDLAPWIDGKIPWEDIESFKRLGVLVKSEAKRLKINIRWGGDWVTFKDYPHFELDWHIRQTA